MRMIYDHWRSTAVQLVGRKYCRAKMSAHRRSGSVLGKATCLLSKGRHVRGTLCVMGGWTMSWDKSDSRSLKVFASWQAQLCGGVRQNGQGSGAKQGGLVEIIYLLFSQAPCFLSKSRRVRETRWVGDIWLKDQNNIWSTGLADPIPVHWPDPWSHSSLEGLSLSFDCSEKIIMLHVAVCI